MESNQTQRVGGVFPLTTPSKKVDDKPASQSLQDNQNVLSDLVSDDIFYTLQEYGLFDEKAIRDYHIRKSFKRFREDMSTNQAIEKLQQLYPYLQFDTLRKIVYKVSKKK